MDDRSIKIILEAQNDALRELNLILRERAISSTNEYDNLYDSLVKIQELIEKL